MEGSTPLSRVLAAVDLSPMGRRVADRARILAEEHGAELTLIHVVAPDAAAFFDAEDLALMRDMSAEAAVRLADWVRARTDLPVSLVMPDGHPVREVAKLARTSDVVLSGTSSLDAARVGPVTRRLARMARVGVVAVRRQPRVPYRRVIAAVDLSESSRQAVELARRMAPHAEITAAFAVVSRFDEVLASAGMTDEAISGMHRQRIEKAEEAMHDFVGLWSDVKPLVVTGPPSQALNEAVRKRSADLVTVANKGGGGDSMVLLGTVAEEVMETAPCDVAVARVDSVFRRP